jgi:hypothetical protein
MPVTGVVVGAVVAATERSPGSFTPSFLHFQADIEQLLKSEGKVEKNEHGQTVFRGYQAALDHMFRLYLENDACAPLVAEFRSWNWEWEYGDYLLELTARLEQKRDWPLLKDLWSGVIAKRRTNYNKTRKAHNALPKKIPRHLVEKTSGLLLDSLHRLCDYAIASRRESEVQEYVEMTERVERLHKA